MATTIHIEETFAVGDRVKIKHRHRTINPDTKEVLADFPAGATGRVVKITHRVSTPREPLLYDFVAYTVQMDSSDETICFLNHVVEGIVRADEGPNTEAP